MKAFEFEFIGGGPILINLEKIECVYKSGDGVAVVEISGEPIRLKDSYEYIKSIINDNET